MLPNVYPQSALGSTIKKIINHAQSNTVITSNDVKVSNSSNGLNISLSDKFKNVPNNYTVYRGNYNYDEAYSKNDIVRVLPTLTYSSSIDDSTITPTPGVWICVEDIPDAISSNDLIQLGYSFADHIRIVDVIYYPIWPEPTTPYWHLLSLLCP